MLNGNATLKLNDGIDILEQWADTARHVSKNLLYKALFSITEGSVFERYAVLQDSQNPHEHFVMVREDLVVKIGFQPGGDGFGIQFIGPLEEAPGLEALLDGLTDSP
jgi:Family of unknown function (DUF6235)